MTSHIHAALMALYAQDAAETDKPWERWEFWNVGSGKWEEVLTGHPCWYSSIQYRRKARTHKVNGIEVPAPMRDAPEFRDRVWIPHLCADELATELTWRDHDWNRRLLARGLVHATKEAAVANAQAMIATNGAQT